MKTFKGKNNEVLGTFLENTDVVVNPTLVGDEPEMTGIQVGGQKYKAPQGGGGGETYTAGEGINISEDNVISAEKTIVLVNELPNEGEADKLYKLPNGDVYEWAEIETQIDVTEISVGKRFILKDVALTQQQFNEVIRSGFNLSQGATPSPLVFHDLRINYSESYISFNSYSSPNVYSSYYRFYVIYSNYKLRKQNFEHHPFIEITQLLASAISAIGGSLEHIAPLFKKEVVYSYGWNKIGNYKLSESLELVNERLSVKNGYVNIGETLILSGTSGYRDSSFIEKLFYTNPEGRLEGFKNVKLVNHFSSYESGSEEFWGDLNPGTVSHNGLEANFYSDILKSENGEYRVKVRLYLEDNNYDQIRFNSYVEYTTYNLLLGSSDSINEAQYDYLVKIDYTNKKIIFKNSFIKTIEEDGSQIVYHPSKSVHAEDLAAGYIEYSSDIIKLENGDSYYKLIRIFTGYPHHWQGYTETVHEEKVIPSWCNGYILTSNYTQMKKARLNMDNLKNTLFNSSDYLSEPISSFIGTGTSYITIAILNNESSGAQRNSMITFICDKLENPDHCRIEVLLERETLYSQEHTFYSENFTWLDVFEFLHNEADISDFNLCNAYFCSGTMILETPDPDEGLALYDSVRFGFSNEIIFGNNDDGSTLYGLVLIKDVKGFFDFVLEESGSSSSSSN